MWLLQWDACCTSSFTVRGNTKGLPNRWAYFFMRPALHVLLKRNLYAASMDNTVAMILIAAIATAFAADAFFIGWGLPVFVMEQVVRLSHWLAFWR